jgi:hypothetical protein
MMFDKNDQQKGIIDLIWSLLRDQWVHERFDIFHSFYRGSIRALSSRDDWLKGIPFHYNAPWNKMWYLLIAVLPEKMPGQKIIQSEQKEHLQSRKNTARAERTLPEQKEHSTYRLTWKLDPRQNLIWQKSHKTWLKTHLPVLAPSQIVLSKNCGSGDNVLHTNCWSE